jgi:NAD(P)-dependent dehydrogenase (short-subunit alcohol dehydrogenase family)
MEFGGKTVLVTGAGSGIGRATAILFAEEGADVAVLSRYESEVAEVCAEIEATGRKALPLVADISEDAQMRAAFETVADTFGTLDVVFANAGINGVWTPIEEMTVEDWDQVNHINLRGTFLTFHYAVPLMKENGGAFVVTSSITGTTTFIYPGTSAYGTTKMGLISYAKSAALELSKYRIRVNAVCPGGIATNISASTLQKNIEDIRYPVNFPKGQVPLSEDGRGDPKQVAQVALFLASDRASHVTGTAVYVDGGQSLVT